MEAIIKAVKLVVESISNDDGTDSEGGEDEDNEGDGTDSEGGDLETIDEDGEENEMSLQDIIKNLRVIVSYISKQVIEVGAEHLDDIITAAGVDITTSITTLDTLMDHEDISK